MRERQARVTRAIGMMAACITTSIVTGQVADASEPAPGDAPNDSRQAISLAGEMELSRLVELTSATAGASIEYQVAELSKRVRHLFRQWQAWNDTRGGRPAICVRTNCGCGKLLLR